MKRDTRLGAMAKLIGMTLCDDFAHHETGRCDPFLATLSEALGTSKDSVKRGLADLERYGWIERIKGRGRGRPSSIKFTARTSAVAVLLPENVHSLADHREGKAAEPMPGKGANLPPITKNGVAKKGAKITQKGCKSALSHSEPKRTKGTRPQHSDEKPVLNNPAVAHFGSDREAEWNRYLVERGVPSLEALGVLSSDADGRGWEVPFRRPPSEHDAITTSITRRWVCWAIKRMEAHHAEA